MSGVHDEEERTGMYMVRGGEGPTKPLGGRGTARRLLTPGAGSQHLELYVNVLEPGSGPGPYHYHSNADNIYVVLDGQGQVTVDGERIPVAPGDMVSLAPGERHDIENTGTGELRVLEIKVPAGSDFITVEDERP